MIRILLIFSDVEAVVVLAIVVPRLLSEAPMCMRSSGFPDLFMPTHVFFFRPSFSARICLCFLSVKTYYLGVCCPKVDRVNRAQEQAIRRKVERFKVEVREKLAAFAMDADPSTISHAFPHVEKSLRSIQ